MDLSDLLPADLVLLDLRIRDKTQLMADLARHFARANPALKPEVVEAALLSRERLGSTGLGAGFALPHARIEAIPKYLGCFARLGRPIEFEAIDGKPVSMVFALLVPAEATSHVAALAAITRRFRDAAFVTQLARSKTPAAAFAILTDS